MSRARGRPAKLDLATKSTILFLRYVEFKSIREIAKEVLLHYSTVGRYLKEYEMEHVPAYIYASNERAYRERNKG